MYVKLLFIHLQIWSVNISVRACDFGGFLWTWIFISWGCERHPVFSLSNQVFYITSHHLVVLHVHIISAGVLTTCLHTGGSHWHLVGCKYATGCYEVTFQLNLLMPLVSLMLWCDNKCKFPLMSLKVSPRY